MRTGRRVGWIAGGAAAGCIGLAGVAGWLLQPPAPPGERVVLVVAPGETPDAVAADLARHHLIRSPWLFRGYAAWTGLARRFQAGRYVFVTGEGMRDIARQLAEGRVARDEVTVTIPEGFTVRQIAARLAASGVCPEQAFLHEVEHGRFDEPFLRQIPDRPQVKYRLEGYLFPDTYRFERNEPAHEVVDAMLRDFQDRVWRPAIRTALRRRHLSLAAAITEASIVEREAKVAAERPLIASVIENRLHHRPPMKLQMDATIEYILGHRDVLTAKDLTVDDPYNTYLYPGLPPGPIANPGMASIQAVLHPARTDYLYYVVRNDGTGRDYFARTYEEQLQNEARSQANLRREEAARRP
ncbi:aminodeoxychorismate lyase [Alicyclobacillus cellulosilyticus]|uniref:Endolytic murein transglycosylase n=1 Tax=Alicyclobacillus cellulosilyticus TaxID=1003997 RepID=A0A917NMM7_9BACL|nr:aminodeoxychorismate lyase [Alicyclobacillus cellulosilyticus]